MCLNFFKIFSLVHLPNTILLINVTYQNLAVNQYSINLYFIVKTKSVTTEFLLTSAVYISGCASCYNTLAKRGKINKINSKGLRTVLVVIIIKKIKQLYMYESIVRLKMQRRVYLID